MGLFFLFFFCFVWDFFFFFSYDRILLVNKLELKLGARSLKAGPQSDAGWRSVALTSQADLLKSRRVPVRGRDAAAPPEAATESPLPTAPPAPPIARYHWGAGRAPTDAALSPGSFPRTPEPLAQGPISPLTLEKQQLHPRAL